MIDDSITPEKFKKIGSIENLQGRIRKDARCIKKYSTYCELQKPLLLDVKGNPLFLDKYLQEHTYTTAEEFENLANFPLYNFEERGTLLLEQLRRIVDIVSGIASRECEQEDESVQVKTIQEELESEERPLYDLFFPRNEVNRLRRLRPEEFDEQVTLTIWDSFKRFYEIDHLEHLVERDYKLFQTYDDWILNKDEIDDFLKTASTRRIPDILKNSKYISGQTIATAMIEGMTKRLPSTRNWYIWSRIICSKYNSISE